MPDPDPVIHHVEICCSDAKLTLERLKQFGYQLFARRETTAGLQLCLKLGKVFVLLNERYPETTHTDNDTSEDTGDLPVTFCCKSKSHHAVDTVFNVSFHVKDVRYLTNRVSTGGGLVIQKPTTVSDCDGDITFSIVKSICGNVLHTLIEKEHYTGAFLVGFQSVECQEDNEMGITHIDHFTLACFPGESNRIIQFYAKCFGMDPFSINKEDTEDDGLILSEDGVGLKLRTMEYFRGHETELKFSRRDRERNQNSVMLVVVETLPGQVSCNIETFLKEHRGPGLEHLALFTPQIVHTVSKLASRGVQFRRPPVAYYSDIEDTSIKDIDWKLMRKLGILFDNETDSSEENKYIMQIFAHPLFKPQQTFFFEIISRFNNARGLGTGNVKALVKSIRQEEMRKVAEAKKEEFDGISSPRRLY